MGSKTGASDTPCALQLEHVSKIYPNGVQAVRDLNLKVAEGELVVIVGPSGCGKTTTLRLIAGLEELSSGTVHLGGKRVNDLPSHRRGVAMVFQSHGLYPFLNIRENLGFGLHLRHGQTFLAKLWQRGKGNLPDGEIDKRVAATAGLLDLVDVLERFPGQVSGGERQRTALGRALVMRPGVVLLDEPLSNLDAPLRTELRRQLHLLHCRIRATMIYVTHDQVEAMTLGNRIAVMDRGVIQQVDKPATVYDQPGNRFVAGFFGSPPMNFVVGRVMLEDGKFTFSSGSWSLPLPARAEARWRTLPAKAVVLGIRPEHVQPAEGQTEAILEVQAVLVESLGSHRIATFRQADWQLCGQLANRWQIAAGQTVRVKLDMEQVHFFDEATGLALDNASPSG